MKTMVIGDIHEMVYWIEKGIKKESPDEVVFVGDYFDSFRSCREYLQDTCEWLIDSVNQKNRVHLFGNHDIWYRFPLCKSLICSGNTMEKLEFIRTIVYTEHWELLKLCHFTQNFLISHAGICKEQFAHPIHGITLQGIQEECNKALGSAKAGMARDSLRAGIYRGGILPKGGINWLDWNEFKPIKGWNQIVGHTPRKDIRYACKYLPNKKDCVSKNFNVDFSGKYYGIIKDGDFQFVKNEFYKEIPWLEEKN